jgi:hypothetical protein
MTKLFEIDSHINNAEFSTAKARTILSEVVGDYSFNESDEPCLEEMVKTTEGTRQWIGDYQRIMIKLNIVLDYLIQIDADIRKITGIIASDDGLRDSITAVQFRDLMSGEKAIA